MDRPLNRRQQKEVTRAKIVETARRLFTERSYHDVGIRLIASEAGHTSGAVFHLFETKANLWRTSMDSEPPLDRPVVRYAEQMEATLRALVLSCRKGSEEDVAKALDDAEALLESLMPEDE